MIFDGFNGGKVHSAEEVKHLIGMDPSSTNSGSVYQSKRCQVVEKYPIRCEAHDGSILLVELMNVIEPFRHDASRHLVITYDLRPGICFSAELSR